MSVREIADNIIELLAARAFAKDIGLGCHVEPDVPQMITADPGRVRQVLLNLIGNAIKFTDRRRRAGQRRACPHRNQRPHLLHHHRHRPRPARRGHGAHLRGVRAGRRHLDAHAWRRRTRTCHLQAPGGRHGRRDLGVEPAWRRVGIRLRNPGHSGHRGAARPAERARRPARGDPVAGTPSRPTPSPAPSAPMAAPPVSPPRVAQAAPFAGGLRRAAGRRRHGRKSTGGCSSGCARAALPIAKPSR